MRGFPGWWSYARRRHCDPHGEGPWAHPGFGGFDAHSGPPDGYEAHGRHRGHGHGGGGGWHPADIDSDGGNFGVRRPLRFMAYKLELSDEQVAELAVILNELKTERAQASVDYRRSVNTLADALAAPAFDEAQAAAAGDERVKSAENVRNAVQKALRKVHALLDDAQRQRLAYLMRTGALTI